LRRLLLWDIDGTIVDGGGVGSRAILDAAATVSGLPSVPRVDMHGKTDPQILRDIFLAAEIADELIDGYVADGIGACESALATLEGELRARGSLYPGVRAVLERIDALGDVRQSLVTGNLVGNAALKLAAFDLTVLFDFEVGAYGTDHADRLELVPIALERVERLRGERYDRDDVWVVGDTANDLACARAAGVRCLLVATGTPTYDSLAALDADAVLHDLSDVDAVVELLTV
jgi:phosphoglycolate phosphatase-like HAD superfamily hydrolase